MFERNGAAVLEQAAVSVEIGLDDGTVTSGRMVIPASRAVFDVLNGQQAFFEFEPFEGERRYIAKSALKSVKLVGGAKPPNLAQKLRDLDGFDPYTILGVSAGCEWDDVRGAYVKAAKTYHPDRFAGTELPEEVKSYFSGMLRRLNAAYASLETAYTARKQSVARRQDAIYTSPTRAC